MVGFGMVTVDAERAKKVTPTYLFKVVLVGDSQTGKTEALMKFTQDTYNPNNRTTIDVDFAVKIVDIGGDIVKLQIWDTAGQERFRTVTYTYYRGAQGIALFFDLTNKDSFENVRRWHQETQRYAHEDVCVVIVGTRSDLIDARVVTDADIETFREEMNLDYFEISCKTGKNLNSFFERLIEKMITSSQVKPIKFVREDRKTNSKTCTIL